MDLSEASDDEVLSLILGRSGTLKAPTIRVGDAVIVGWSEDAYRTVFSGD